jgi:A nuclease of the HNH/ENDO VII superfamily with conserved WHH/Pretoxin HINT domain
VKAIGPCPTIDPGPGRVITATIRHASAEVWHLQADLAPTASATKSSSIPCALAKASPLVRTLRAAALGLLGFAAPLVATAASLAPGMASLEAVPVPQHSSLSSPSSTVVIRPTGQHPFWSETRLAWVPARDLRVGEHLTTESGSPATVTSLVRESGTQPVFNLEVEMEHVYFVSAGGVLVHNACTVNPAKLKPAQRAASKGFHGIKSTKNGGPDFKSSKYMHPSGKGEQRIPYTGSRDGDFDVANFKAGFEETPDGYTWHHLDDYDPITNSGTMQLVRSDAHLQTLPHTGGVAQYQTIHNSGY